MVTLSGSEQVEGALQAYFSGSLLKQINRQLEQVNSNLSEEDATLLGVQVTTSQSISSPVEREVLDNELETNHFILQKQRVYRIIDEFVTTLPKKKQDILNFRHKDLLKWDDVATKTHYSEKQCRRINKDLVFRLGMKLSILTNYF